ncbi:MAG: hypothetical protein V4451_04825 [Pseudomonadota bacterium]
MNYLAELLALVVFSAAGVCSWVVWAFWPELQQAAWMSWQWLTFWDWPKVVEWTGAALTIYGAWLLTLTTPRAPWGFVFFLAANGVWMYFATLTSLGGLFTQQAVLTVISCKGIWAQLAAPRLEALFTNFIEEPKV